MALQHLRSSTANKRPTPAGMSDGQLALNTNDASPGLFFKDSNGALVKVGPVHVGATAPNATPGAGGSSGNSVGEQWLDTTGGSYVFKVWDGSAWRSESGTFVDVNGDVMTGALGIIAGSAGSPGLYFSGDTNTGLYSPGADQVAISTNGTGRLFIDSSGRVGLGNAGPGNYNAGFNQLVVGSSGDQGVTIVSGTSNSGTLAFADGTSGADAYRGYVQYQHGSTNALVFATDGSERFRCDSSGRLLVGTSSYSGNGKVAVAGNTGGNAGALDICWAGSRPTTAGTDIGYIRWYSADNSSSNAHYASIYATSDGDSSSGSDIPGRLVFSTTADGASSPTERMRIDSTGRCFFNTTASPSTTSFGTSIGTVLAHSRDTSTGAVAQIYGSAGEFRIIGSGNAQNTNNSYGAISDQSLKTDISDAGSQWDDIKGITVRKFKLIGTDNLQIGVVAQECELVSPGLVEDTVLEQEDGTTFTVKAVKYSVLYMKAVKALQEAMERIEQLEQRLADAGI